MDLQLTGRLRSKLSGNVAQNLLGGYEASRVASKQTK